MISEKHIALLIMLLATATVYGIFGSYYYTMEDIWRTAKRIEVLKNEIFHLSTSVEEEKEAIAPLVLRLFSYSKEDSIIRIYYGGVEIWRGSLSELNTTYNVVNFGEVHLRISNGSVVASAGGYSHVLNNSYQEEMLYVVENSARWIHVINDAIRRDEENLTNLKNLLSSISWSPLMFAFLLVPVASIAIQLILLRILDSSLLRKYIGVILNPYLLLPFLFIYAALILLTVMLNKGDLIPLHAIMALYVLTAIPSLASPVLYLYERIIE